MNQIQKEYHFSAGHLLPNHNGKCRNSHGHNYKVVVCVGGQLCVDGNSSEGMVIDFKDLDKRVAEIIDPMDHKFLAKGDEWIALAAKEYGTEDQICLLGVRTTAENLAEYIGKKLRPIAHGDVFVQWVEVFETEKAGARWSMK